MKRDVSIVVFSSEHAARKRYVSFSVSDFETRPSFARSRFCASMRRMTFMSVTAWCSLNCNSSVVFCGLQRSRTRV